MKIVSVVGARPNFMKITPIAAAIDQYNRKYAKRGEVIKHILVHTGQHYDELMSDIFFDDLSLPIPDVYLGVGSASHAQQTANLLVKFEKVLLEQKPDIVIVVGDVNSTVACALATSKIVFDTNSARPLIAHVEAGLRSFDNSMPEEINRILTDHMSDLLFVTETSGLSNLKREGLSKNNIFFVGNTMIDTLLSFKDAADKSLILEHLGLRGKIDECPRPIVPYALLTLHRPSNVDNKDTLEGIVDAINTVSKSMPVIFPCHPRTRNKLAEFGIKDKFHYVDIKDLKTHDKSAECNIMKINNRLYLLSPLGYIDFLCLMSNAKVVLTDSGGIQEETTCLGIPCITLRSNTERPVTISHGTNMLSGTKEKDITRAFDRTMRKKIHGKRPKYWDGKTSQRIIKILIDRHKKRQ
jgi:UDP-N-acetylglucosamine 2-epimerase (non-hydrolysing)